MAQPMAKHLKLEVHEAWIVGSGQFPGEGRAKGARKVSEQFAVDSEEYKVRGRERKKGGRGGLKDGLLCFSVMCLLTTSFAPLLLNEISPVSFKIRPHCWRLIPSSTTKSKFRELSQICDRDQDKPHGPISEKSVLGSLLKTQRTNQ